MKAQPHNVRVQACEILYSVLAEGRSLNTALPEHLPHTPEKDRGLLQELVYGTCRWYFQLQEMQNALVRRPLTGKDLKAAILIIIGCYQLQFTRIPNHAAINETVSACETLNIGHLKGLVNAVLRKLSAHALTINPSWHAASHPEWMRAKILNNWPDHAEHIFRENNAHPPMTLRINDRKIRRDDLIASLASLGIASLPCRYSPVGLTLAQAMDVHLIPGFDDGAVSVQDEAAQLCTGVLDLNAGQRVLDACAAPGGKTSAILEYQPDVQLLALDNDELRCRRIEENLSRLGLDAKIVCADAQEPDNWWDGKLFDRILLDAPCSASGVIRRHPDIKLLRHAEDIKQLAETQLTMLKRLWPCLKPGGRLLYATCSIFPQENTRIIERFLKHEDSALHAAIEADWGIETQYGRQLFPQSDGHDGFFYACLIKKASTSLDTSPD